MSVLFNSVTATSTSFGSSVSFSHSTAGIDRLITVGTMADAIGRTVSSVTYNGVALVNVGGNSGNGYRTELWRGIAPATGSNTVAVTWSSGGFNAAGAISFTGVDQTTPTSGYQSSNGNASTRSVTVTSKVGDFVVDVLGSFQNPSVGSGQTQRWSESGFEIGVGSTEPGAASVTMSWTFGFGTDANMSAMNINQVSSTARRRIFQVN